jgi:hypothetical protein
VRLAVRRTANKHHTVYIPPDTWHITVFWWWEYVKVNFDAAFQEESRSGAWGFVLRSEQGTFLASAAGTIEHVKFTHTAKRREKEQIKYMCK